MVRAVGLLAQTAGVTRGTKLRLVKRIPSAAGLGGGSSDAAATLIAANLVWNLGWPPERLAEVAAQLGSDVPFFLANGPAVCGVGARRSNPFPGWRAYTSWSCVLPQGYRLQRFMAHAGRVTHPDWRVCGWSPARQRLVAARIGGS